MEAYQTSPLFKSVSGARKHTEKKHFCPEQENNYTAYKNVCH